MAEPDTRRQVPRSDTVLADPRLVAAVERVGRVRVKAVVAEVLGRVRTGGLAPELAADAAVAALPETAATQTRVINATGVVLHTNLGRAPLSTAARAAVDLAAGYTDLEFDLVDGRRARRGRGTLDALRAAVPLAGDVHVVNNGAAALLLAVAALAAGREIVVSRGELVEIGDGFRLPELIEATGARIHEVGTTNRVRLEDYRDAIGPDTSAVLKVHPSNFRIDGFTSSVEVDRLAGLDLPVIVDTGSGLLAPHPLLPDEPDVHTALRRGAAVVTCSADKLLGGPQAGLLFGDAALIDRLRRHPVARALRVDKLTLAALDATLTGPTPPTWAYLNLDPATSRERAGRLADTVGSRVVPHTGAVGGGGGVGVDLTGWAVELDPALAGPLRLGDPAVVGRVHEGRLLLDLRCVDPADDASVAAAVLRARGRV